MNRVFIVSKATIMKSSATLWRGIESCVCGWVLLICRTELLLQLFQDLSGATAGGRGGAEMSIRSAEGMSIMQALAMTVAEIPVFLYSTFGQVHSSTHLCISDHTPHSCSLHTNKLSSYSAAIHTCRKCWYVTGLSLYTVSYQKI